MPNKRHEAAPHFDEEKRAYADELFEAAAR